MEESQRGRPCSDIGKIEENKVRYLHYQFKESLLCKCIP